MLLVACALALLVIYAGMKLLALTKKDSLGNLYRYVSWFIIIVGFLLVLCVAAHCVMRVCHCGDKMMMQTDMRDGYDGRGMDGMNHHRWMMRDGCYGGMMRGSCDGTMRGCDGSMKDGACCGGMNGGHCDGMKDGNCGNSMGSCRGGMDSNMKGCTMGAKDTTAPKKK